MSYIVHVLGGGIVGRTIAERLLERGETVVVVDQREEQVAEVRAALPAATVVRGDVTDTQVLESAGVASADVVVAATADDDANLLSSQLVRGNFDARVISRVNRPENQDAFEELGIETVSTTAATASVIDDVIERPSITRWFAEVGHTGDVQEIEIANPELDGTTIAELDTSLPEQCIVLMVGATDVAHLPRDDETLSLGEHVTLLGEREAVARGTRLLEGRT